MTDEFDIAVDKVSIISMPEATNEQIENLGKVIMMAGSQQSPVYLTKAKLKPIDKKDILDWLEALLAMSVELGWSKDVQKIMKSLADR